MSRCLVLGLVAVLVASCGDSRPLCEGCVVVDEVPAITNMTLDHDGRIIATVQGSTGTALVRAIARLDRFGVLDRRFGEQGFAPYESSVEPKAIIVQQSGAIRIGGVAAEPVPVVYGFTADGHDDGLRITGSGVFRQPVQYLMDQGGALVASHARYKELEGVLVRYAENGARDTSFEPTAVEQAVAITTDGAFVTAGSSLDEPDRRFLVRRVTRDGQVDASFGGGSVVIPDVERGSGQIRVASRSGGGLVMAGVAGNDTPRVIVARFDGTGTLDASFGGHGYVTYDFGRASIVAIVELTDGGVLLAGVLEISALAYRALIVRLARDGSPDASFGERGRFVLDKDNSFFSGLVVTADGDVIAGGSSGERALLMTFPPP
jgi:uncharacterized delta-60 repeat protein